MKKESRFTAGERSGFRASFQRWLHRLCVAGMVLPSGIEPESPASEASVLSVRLQEQGASPGVGPGVEGAHPVFDLPGSQALSCSLRHFAAKLRPSLPSVAENRMSPSS